MKRTVLTVVVAIRALAEGPLNVLLKYQADFGQGRGCVVGSLRDLELAASVASDECRRMGAREFAVTAHDIRVSLIALDRIGVE